MAKLLKLSFIILCFLVVNLQAKQFERRYMGKDDAPVVMYEFLSLSCVHCATFSNQVMPKIKKEYVDTGKLKVVFIDVPFGTPATLIAHSLLYQTKDSEDFFALASFLLKEQGKWVKSGNPQALARLFGLSGKNIVDAQNNTRLQNWLKDDAKEMLSKLNIQGTPTFLLSTRGNDVYSFKKRFEGFTSYDKLKKAIEELL